MLGPVQHTPQRCAHTYVVQLVVPHDTSVFVVMASHSADRPGVVDGVCGRGRRVAAEDLAHISDPCVTMMQRPGRSQSLCNPACIVVPNGFSCAGCIAVLDDAVPPRHVAVHVFRDPHRLLSRHCR